EGVAGVEHHVHPVGQRLEELQQRLPGGCEQAVPGDAHQVPGLRIEGCERRGGDLALRAVHGEERPFGRRLQQHGAVPGVGVGPRPWAPPCTATAPVRAAAISVVTAPPAYFCPRRTFALPPRGGRPSISRITSTSAWAVWSTRDMARV